MILEGTTAAQVIKVLLTLLLFAGFFTLMWKFTKKEWWWEWFKK